MTKLTDNAFWQDAKGEKAVDTNSWQLLLVDPKGQWRGLKSPEKRLWQWLVLLVLLLSGFLFSTTAWILSRSRAEKLSQLYVTEQLKSRAHFEENLRPLMLQQGAFTLPEQVSYIPALGQQDLRSPLVSADDLLVRFNAEQGEVELKFQLNRGQGAEGRQLYRWILVLHGPSALLSFPPALRTEHGDLLDDSKAEEVYVERVTRQVQARFRVSVLPREGRDILQEATLLVYNEQGSLVLSQRRDLSLLE